MQTARYIITRGDSVAIIISPWTWIEVQAKRKGDSMSGAFWNTISAITAVCCLRVWWVLSVKSIKGGADSVATEVVWNRHVPCWCLTSLVHIVTSGDVVTTDVFDVPSLPSLPFWLVTSLGGNKRGDNSDAVDVRLFCTGRLKQHLVMRDSRHPKRMHTRNKCKACDSSFYSPTEPEVHVGVQHCLWWWWR